MKRELPYSFETCYTDSQENCLINVMKAYGASSESIAFSEKIISEYSMDGYIMKYIETGVVDVVQVDIPFPFRMNTNQAYLLVNGNPEILCTESPSCIEDIKKDPLYPSLLKRYPGLQMWFNGNEYMSVKKLPGGGQRFLFNYYLVDGCHACGIGVEGVVAFDFDKQGNFIGDKFIKLVKTNKYKE